MPERTIDSFNYLSIKEIYEKLGINNNFLLEMLKYNPNDQRQNFSATSLVTEILIDKGYKIIIDPPLNDCYCSEKELALNLSNANLRENVIFIAYDEKIIRDDKSVISPTLAAIYIDVHEIKGINTSEKDFTVEIRRKAECISEKDLLKFNKKLLEDLEKIINAIGKRSIMRTAFVNDFNHITGHNRKNRSKI